MTQFYQHKLLTFTLLTGAKAAALPIRETRAIFIMVEVVETKVGVVDL
jgi:hypothetical protein